MTESGPNAESGPIARVLLETSVPRLDHLFDYRIPPGLSEIAQPGVRVRVPLRAAGRITSGFLIERGDAGEYGGEVSDLDEVLSPARVLQPEVWALARKVADRGAGSAHDVIRLAVPPRQVRVEKSWLAAQASVASGEAAKPDSPPIRGYPPSRLESAIRAGERLAVDAIPRLAPLPSGDWVGEWAITLAAAAARTVAGGYSAILVVPDYRDQEQLAAALATLLPAELISRVDARQSNPERYLAFLQCLGDRPQVILGNRSAVYMPAATLGLIALWDDGDSLHSEPLAPYAHARDVALLRQAEQRCALLFLGHTRSVPVQRLVELGWLGEVAAAPAVTPRVIVTARQDAGGSAALPARIPSAAWRDARTAVQSGPVLVQVARPGYAPVLACQKCHKAARCARCAGPLGIGGAAQLPSCGWCGSIATDWSCPHCSSTKLRLVTVGAGRTAEELGRAFPGVKVIVADGQRPLLRVGAEPALVVATRGAEPIPPGGYRAVLLLDGERMLARESLTVAEDCLRWWSNASALAGAGAPTVLVGVGGAVATALSTWRQAGYASVELADRRILGFPPAVRTASISGHPAAVEQAIAALKPGSFIDVLGPVAVADPASNDVSAQTLRAIVRFDYANGAAVATALRAAIVRNAAGRRATPTGAGKFRRPPKLKVRFDDPEIS
ncbi:MAG: primosomal protein N' [Microbacteriaceae bacterium]